MDLNGDGQPEFLTGKRFMAHNGRDPGERQPLGVYWYEFVKAENNRIEWVKHVVDYSTRTGGGMQMPAADLDGDGDIDSRRRARAACSCSRTSPREPHVPPGRKGSGRN